MQIKEKKTYLPKVEDLAKNRKWYLIDAKGKVLGRLASRIALILRGKNKPDFTPHFLCGSGVIIINAGQIKVTGRKMDNKLYQKYTGYPSGRKVIPLKELLQKNPAKIIYYAVRGMLPKNKLSRQILSKLLKVYAGPEHKHQAQKPIEVSI